MITSAYISQKCENQISYLMQRLRLPNKSGIVEDQEEGIRRRYRIRLVNWFMLVSSEDGLEQGKSGDL